MIHYHAKARDECKCDALHSDAVQTTDYMQIDCLNCLAFLRDRSRLLRDEAQDSVDWTDRKIREVVEGPSEHSKPKTLTPGVVREIAAFALRSIRKGRHEEAVAMDCIEHFIGVVDPDFEVKP